LLAVSSWTVGLLRRLGFLRLQSGWLRVRVPSVGESRG